MFEIIEYFLSDITATLGLIPCYGGFLKLCCLSLTVLTVLVDCGDWIESICLLPCKLPVGICCG